jgi:hypothetical protein
MANLEVFEERLKKLKKFIGNKKKIKASVLKPFVLDLGYSKYNPSDIKEFFPNLEIEKDLKGGTPAPYMDKKKLNVANKYARLLNKKKKNDRHYVSSKNYAAIPSNEKVLILNILASNDNKFTKDYSDQLRFDPKKEKLIKKAFDLTEDDFIKHGKHGVPTKIDGKHNPKYQHITKFVERGFKFLELDALSADDIEFVKNNFEPPKGTEWNFKSKDNPKGYKHGLQATKFPNLEKQIYNKLKGSRKYTLAAERGSPQGWIMHAMERVYNNEKRNNVKPKDLTYQPKFNKKTGIIVGFTDNTVAGDGKTYYGLKKNTREDGAVWTGHGDYNRINKFLKIAKGVKKDPSKLLQEILDDKGITKLLGDRRFSLNDILSHERYFDKLSTTAPKKLIERQIVLHHARGVGSGGELARAAATKDIQLLTGLVNSKVSGLEKIVQGTSKKSGRKLNLDEIAQLKNYGAKIVDFDGKVVGGGYLDPERQFANIEKGALKYAQSDKFNVKTVSSYLKALIAEGTAGGPICGLVRKAGAVGGSQVPGCGDEVRQALQDDPDKLIQEAADSKVKPGENTKFRTIARQILSKLPKGGRLGAILAGAGAVGLGTAALMGDAEAEETQTTDQTMTYNSTTGEFVNTETGDPEDQQSKLDWIAENPVKSGLMGLPITIGLGYVAGGAKTMPGRYLTSWKAAIPAMMIPEKMHQWKTGMEAGEMITDPLNAIWALGIESKADFEAARKWYEALPEGQRTRLMSMKTLKDLGTTQGWKNLPKGLRNAILSPAAAGTDLAFQKRLKPAVKKLTESIIGSPGAKQVAKKGLGALAKRVGIGLGAAALLPATVAAGLVSAPLTLGLGALSFGYAQYKDYRDGKAIVDSMRAKGKISEEDAEKYMSLIKQGSLPFGLGNRLWGDDEMTMRGQNLNPDQQRQLLAGMEGQIDLFQEGRRDVRALDRADDFDFFSEGGRVGLWKGGGMDRRGFLKWLAALGATVVGGASGLFKTGAKKGIEQAVKQVPKQFANVPGMPAWFPRAVQKIKTHGKLIEMADKDYVNGDIYEMIIPTKVPKMDVVAGKETMSGFKTVNKKVILEENPVSGEIEISWSVDDFDGEMTRQINFKPGQSGFQKFGADPEHPGAWEFQRVKVDEPEFTYGNPDQTTPERDAFEFKDIFEEGDEVVKGLEDLTGNKKMVTKDGTVIDTTDAPDVDEAFQKKIFKDIEGEGAMVPDPEGHMTPDGWSGDKGNPIIGGDIPSDILKKKARGGTVETGDIARRQSLVPPLAGPDPQGIMGLYSAPKQVRVG